MCLHMNHHKIKGVFNVCCTRYDLIVHLIKGGGWELKLLIEIKHFITYM